MDADDRISMATRAKKNLDPSASDRWDRCTECEFSFFCNSTSETQFLVVQITPNNHGPEFFVLNFERSLELFTNLTFL